MTNQEYRKHNGNYFSGKKAVMLKAIRNNGGSTIEKGEEVIISCKSGRGGFNIQSTLSGVYISQVKWDDLDLINNPEL